MNLKMIMVAGLVFILPVSAIACDTDNRSPLKKSRTSSDDLKIVESQQDEFIDNLSKGQAVLSHEVLDRLQFSESFTRIAAIAHKDDRYAYFALCLVQEGFINRSILEKKYRGILININLRANQNHRDAFRNMAYMYKYGIGGWTYPELADEYFKKAGLDPEAEQSQNKLPIVDDKEEPDLRDAAIKLLSLADSTQTQLREAVLPKVCSDLLLKMDAGLQDNMDISEQEHHPEREGQPSSI